MLSMEEHQAAPLNYKPLRIPTRNAAHSLDRLSHGSVLQVEFEDYSREWTSMQELVSESSPKFDQRPWGSFTVLDEGDGFKVKRIEVLAGKRLSYQKHAQRAEHWVVVSGTAKVTLDDKEIMVLAGEAIDIEIGSAHRVENPGGDLLVFIEVQRGRYLGEDDIVRLQDDFGRTG